MSAGLTKEDANKVAAALLEAIKADASTTGSAKASVARILEGAGASALGQKVAGTDPDVWSSVWSSIKDFFVQIWEGLAGAAEALFETIGDWLS